MRRIFFNILFALALLSNTAIAKPTFTMQDLRSIESNDLEGELYTLCVWPKKGNSVSYMHHIKTAEGKYIEVFFPEGTALPESGSRVKLKKAFMLGSKSLYSVGSVDRLLAPAVKYDGLGEKKVLVNLTDYSDKPGGNKATVASYSTIYSQVKDGFWSQSFSNIAINATILEKVSVSQKSTDKCDGTFLYGMIDEAKKQAAAKGFDINQFQHIQMVLPATNNCGWCGLGSVGGPYTWINACNSYTVVGHELGHNFGLLHSNRFDNCSATDWRTGCSNVEYGDGASLQGVAEGEFTAVHKSKLKWLDFASANPQTQLIKENGTYFIEPLETQSTGVKALRFERSPGEFYYVEYRQPINYDARINSSYHKALGIHLMMTNSTAAWRLKNVGIGQSFVDPSFPGGKLSISLQSFSAKGAFVEVTFGTTPTPTPTVKPTATPTVNPTPTATPTVKPTATPPPAAVTIFVAPKQQEYTYDAKRVFWSSVEVVVRKNDKPAANVLSHYKVINSNSKLMYKLQRNTDKNGYIKFGLPIDKSMIPGKYIIQVDAVVNGITYKATNVEFIVR